MPQQVPAHVSLHRSALVKACVVASLLFLSACQGADPVKIHAQILKGSYGKAINKLENALEKTPQDPTLSALLLKARLLQCAETQCTRLPEFVPENFTTPAAAVTSAVQLEDGTKLTLVGIHEDAATRFAALSGQPSPTLAIMAVAPDAAKAAYPNALFRQVKSDLAAGHNTQATDLLTILTKTPVLHAGIKNMAGMLLGMVQKQPSLAEGFAIALRNDKTAAIPPASAEMYLYLLSQQSGFPQDTLTTISAAKIPALQQTSALAAMASEVNRLTPAHVSGTAAPLEHMALSLTLNPAQPALWQTFLPLAEADAAGTADASYFANLTQFAPLPPEVQTQFLTSIFKLIETRSAAKQSILPLLQSIGQIKLDKTNETRLEKLVQTGLQTAIAAENVEEVLAYARFRPEIAQASRQNITPLMVSTIRTDLQKEQFERVTDLGIALQEIGIDFDMDTLMLQELQEYFKTKNLSDELSATGPDWLLKQPAAARIDLGALYGFAQTYFEDKPSVLTSQLKNLAVSARGTYGLPSALYRLDSYFDDTDYPPEQRKAYLAGSIAKAVEADTSRSPAELMDVVGQLSLYHEGLNLPPLISSLLARASQIDDARQLWQAAGGPVREILGRTHAQFTALMRAIDAMDAKNLNLAADALNELETPAYTEMAKPYVTTLRTRLAEVIGIYAAQNLTVPTGAPAIIVLTAPSLNGIADLTRVDATFFNTLGSRKDNNPKTLETDHAAIQPQTVATRTDFANLIFTPSSGASPLFTRLSLLPSGSLEASTLTWQNGKTTATYSRVLHDPAGSLLPIGTFSIAQAAPAATMLPAGSMVQITGDAMGLTGKIWHPASVSPLPATVTYNPQNFTTRISYGYPLPASSQPAFAEVKCQVLPGYLRCGAHHRHSAREQFSGFMSGEQTAESLAQTTSGLAAANAATDALIPAQIAKLPVLTLATVGVINGMAAVSGTSLIHASSTEILAAPVLEGETVSTSTVSATAASSTLARPPEVPVP